MKDSTRDTIVKVLIMYKKKSQYSIFNKPPQGRKSLTEIIFSIYTRVIPQNIFKANSFSHLVTEVRRQ